jgi:uncharacterized protein (DUF58 family)
MVPSARLLWWVALVCAPAAALGGLLPGAAIPAVLLIAGVLAFAVVDALLSRQSLDQVDVVTPDLVRLYRDREGEIPLRIVRKDAMAQEIRVALPLPDPFETPLEIRQLRLDAVNDSMFVWNCTGRRRGKFAIDGCYVEAASRFGFWAVRRKCPVSLELRVYPNLRTLDALAALQRGSQGMNILRQVGKGREFEKLREYLPGDGFDEIHWKATARRGKPITKVFQVERTQEIYVVIDAARLSGRPAGKDLVLERYIQAALVLGAAAERNGDLFGLVTFSDQVQGFVRARNGKAHYSACRDALYQLNPKPVSPDFDELASFLRLRLRRRALIVVLTELDDPMVSESFARATRLLASQHVLLAAMLRPEGVAPLFSDGAVESENDVYERLAQHLAWRGLKETELELRRQRVRFVLLQPDTVCQQLVSTYTDIKQRQII